jgi:hypothetical protein
MRRPFFTVVRGSEVVRADRWWAFGDCDHTDDGYLSGSQLPGAENRMPKSVIARCRVLVFHVVVKTSVDWHRNAFVLQP